MNRAIQYQINKNDIILYPSSILDIEDKRGIWLDGIYLVSGQYSPTFDLSAGVSSKKRIIDLH